MQPNAKKTSSILLIAAAFCLFLLPVFTLFLQGRFLLERETAFLGRVHQEHPEWEAEVLEMLYEETDSEEELSAGQKAFLENGYTRKGPGILKGRLMQRKALLIGGGASVLLTAALLLLFLRLQKLHREDLTKLSQENRDLSEQLMEIPVLQRQNARLQQFIENIAHQIKTPLSRAMTSMELLRDFTEEENRDSEEHFLPDFLRPFPLKKRRDDEKNAVYSERVSECITHLLGIRELIDRLLAIGRMEAGEVVFSSDPISLPAVLSEVLSEVPEENRPHLSKNPENAAFIWHGSYSWTREAIRNLITNCLTHGKSSEPADITLFEQPEEYRITIRDHGPGFSDEDLPNIFDRFYQPQEVKKGHVGLGLNLAKLIIEGQKGEITAGNHPEGGAVFTLFLPRFPEMK